MLLDIALIVAALAVGAALWSPKVHGSATWRAMTTPLASIIGSGFLVLGPVLDHAYGRYAPLAMAALCLGAYAYGAAIRYNMAERDRNPDGTGASVRIEAAASWALAFAYVISVAYYLNLLGAFAVSLTPFDAEFPARTVTTAVFALILFVGWTRGFRSLERMEYISVSIKLAIIAALLVGLGVYFQRQASAGGLLLDPPTASGLGAITLGFGLIVTVQGFETSRYLGEEYARDIRIRSMKWAQWVSSAIYIAYIVLIAYAFDVTDAELTETAIVDMMAVVTPILPLMLVAAALAAQFSAAVADTSGSGGLVAEMTGGRLSPKLSYAVLTAIGLALTWVFDVFQIIGFASRAFALYYGLQSTIAAVTAWRRHERFHALGFAILAVLGALIVAFGQSVEG